MQGNVLVRWVGWIMAIKPLTDLRVNEAKSYSAKDQYRQRGGEREVRACVETAGQFAVGERGAFKETDGVALHKVHGVHDDQRLQEDTGPDGEGFELQHKAREEYECECECVCVASYASFFHHPASCQPSVYRDVCVSTNPSGCEGNNKNLA